MFKRKLIPLNLLTICLSSAKKAEESKEFESALSLKKDQLSKTPSPADPCPVTGISAVEPERSIWPYFNE